jgi:hypothetical protein
VRPLLDWNFISAELAFLTDGRASSARLALCPPLAGFSCHEIVRDNRPKFS